jgi:tetratricopeptide (TPR) repeat protein
MLGFGWLTLRQAQEALRFGRLEEAQRLLSQPAAQGHRKQAGLMTKLARAFADRGQRQLHRDDADAAWRDLLAAEALQTAERSVEELRQKLNRLALAEVRALLQAGNLRRAEEALARSRGRGVRSSEMGALQEAIHGWTACREQAERGEFRPALQAFDRIGKLVAAPRDTWDRIRAEWEDKKQACAALLIRLKEASAQARWADVVELVDQVLAVAPQHAEARHLRSQAWKALAPATLVGPTMAPAPQPNQAVGEGGPAPRFLLWIDGVGGYLICLGGRLTLGQAVPGSRVDVPLVADVSRMHATLTRDVEGYMLEALRPIQVNARPATRTLLRPDDRVTLGASCQMIFRQPAPVSLSARLDLVSGHRLPLAIDAVLLMADTLVVGSSPQAHVMIADLKQPLVFFRNKDQLGVRYAGPLTINGKATTGRCLLEAQARVATDELTITLEPAATRLG